ncbi:hypothetical protein BSL82_02405 [Tardibacter chloracetimidivorans]|uniref:Uncharacterized protein n=1 Tax=Tardibacter chloracetimidivorans TaxID=1921510 RepID=A0A1L3ZRP8_9SPHN|nr:hypothetical protein [Tardibacter chloracetimidivorans]API58299.1 hypothetical protein BSL82_02405 [Tardibacter chloracetimidivorans]
MSALWSCIWLIGAAVAVIDRRLRRIERRAACADRSDELFEEMKILALDGLKGFSRSGGEVERAPFTPEQEERIREMVREALRAHDQASAEAIRATIRECTIPDGIRFTPMDDEAGDRMMDAVFANMVDQHRHAREERRWPNRIKRFLRRLSGFRA